MVSKKYYQNEEKKKGIEIQLVDAQLMAKSPLEISFDFVYEDFIFLDNRIVDGGFEYPWAKGKKLQFRTLQRKDADATRESKQQVVESLIKKAVDEILDDMKARLNTP